MAEGHVPNGNNLLLRELIDENSERPSLELVTLGTRQKLYEPDKPIDFVYFPVDGVVSMLAQLDEKQLVEVATVGNEGFIGLPLFLGACTTPGYAFSQVPGQAYRLPAADFTHLINRPSRLTLVLHRYTQALMTQISQGTACNRVHQNEQRCARWLLLTHDRVGKDEFSLTQEFLGQMLGVRRATVSEIASEFQAQGAIEYSRGIIRIMDRAKLQKASCRCYDIIRSEYERMYSDISARHEAYSRKR